MPPIFVTFHAQVTESIPTVEGIVFPDNVDRETYPVSPMEMPLPLKNTSTVFMLHVLSADVAPMVSDVPVSGGNAVNMVSMLGDAFLTNAGREIWA